MDIGVRYLTGHIMYGIFNSINNTDIITKLVC